MLSCVNFFRPRFLRLRRWRDDRRGGVALGFAVSMIPMALATLGVVQFAMIIATRTKLNAIADAAALQAVSSVAMTAYVNSGTTGQAQAKTMFNTQAAQVSGVTITALNTAVTFTAATSTTPSTLTSSVSYTATIPSIVPGLIGSTFTTVGGASTASASLPSYINFYLLLDDSPSMGIGATPSDITAMQNANNGCAFACHSPNAYNGTYPGYTLPNVPGTQLRIDALRNATAQLISTAIAQQTVPNQFGIGLYTFANTVTTVSPLTNNLAAVQAANTAIQLPTTDLGTQIGDAVDWLSRRVVTANSGNGSQSSPFEFVFLVTDGVEDQAFNFTSGNYDTLSNPYGAWYGTPYSGSLNPAACTGLKNKGVTVAVLYTNYNPLSDVRYTSMVQPFASNILPALQSCASPNFFFQADSASDINTAMQRMFALALQKSAHLTN